MKNKALIKNKVTKSSITKSKLVSSLRNGVLPQKLEL